MAKDYFKLLYDITKAIDKLPARIGAEAVRFSKERFVKQNWLDKGAEPWEKRRRKRSGGERRQNGAILVGSGRLKRSIRVASAGHNRIVIATDVPYAEIHNEGLKSAVNVRSFKRTGRSGRKHTVKAHTRQMNMPQRRFLGESEELANRIEKLIIDNIENAIKQ